MSLHSPLKPIGRWRPGQSPPEPFAAGLARSLLNVTRPIYVVRDPEGPCLSQEGAAQIGAPAEASGGELPLLAYVPPLHPDALGDAGFKARCGLRYAYVVGEMANGITSVEMVRAAGRAGMLGFFGAAGLLPAEVEEAIARLQAERPAVAFGVNLIHSPGNLELESALVELFLRRQVRMASASAFVEPTWPLVYYRSEERRVGTDC